MFWVLVFGAIALLGLAVTVSYVVWLAHKASDVLAEVRVVLERLGQAGDILGQIRIPVSADEDTMPLTPTRPVARPRITPGEDPSASASVSEPALST